MIRTLLCLIVGHRPFEYNFESETETYHNEVYYVECARCGRRKNLCSKGWYW